MKFVSAGHCNVKGKTYDSGAVGVNGRKEADETVRIRNRVIQLLHSWGYKDVIKDLDTESLGQYIERIKTGNGSVVVEFHFNASDDPTATGTETVMQKNYDKLDHYGAKQFSTITANALGIKKRRSDGTLTEAETPRKSLGLMRENGIVLIVEVCFITNPKDMAAFDKNFESLCHGYAGIIAELDNLVK